MPYIFDKEEVSCILGKDLGTPVYRTIRTDEAGNEVAVPVFRISKKKRKVYWKRKMIKMLGPGVGIVALVVLFWFISILVFGLTAQADEPGYKYIEQTEDPVVIELTENVSEIYPICPELLQALIFYESSNQRTAVSRWGDIGYMQVNPRWMRSRMDKLGVDNLKDGYSNILVGTDYLYELFQEYQEPALVLMAYNQGQEKAVKLYKSGKVSEYASKILELAEQLERFHGK